MSELTDFLEARLAEDESFALSAQAEASIYEEPKWHWLVAHKDGSRWHPTTSTPARVLVEVEAKRAIVALHSPYEFPQVMTYGTIIACNECGSVDDSPMEWPCPTLRLLASVYRDHPGYQEGWAL